jgi:hypothetical protein
LEVRTPRTASFECLLIADDLTGAGDAGVPFALRERRASAPQASNRPSVAPQRRSQITQDADAAEERSQHYMPEWMKADPARCIPFPTK